LTDSEVVGSLYRIRKAMEIIKNVTNDLSEAGQILLAQIESQKEKRIIHTVEPKLLSDGLPMKLSRSNHGFVTLQKLPIEEPEYFSSKPNTSKTKVGSSVTAQDVLKNPLVEYRSPIGKDCVYILDKIRQKNPKTTTRKTLHRELRKQYHFRAIDEIIKELVNRGKIRIEPMSYSNNKGLNTVIIKTEKIILL